jgi:hypothetical protein
VFALSFSGTKVERHKDSGYRESPWPVLRTLREAGLEPLFSSSCAVQLLIGISTMARDPLGVNLGPRTCRTVDSTLFIPPQKEGTPGFNSLYNLLVLVPELFQKAFFGPFFLNRTFRRINPLGWQEI